MGEIGIPRREYLYELTYCDILLIERGYTARTRQMWLATRWQTYYSMLAFVGSDNLSKSGITGPRSLLEFPWEREAPTITDDEVKQLKSQMDGMREALRKARESKPEAPISKLSKKPNNG